MLHKNSSKRSLDQPTKFEDGPQFALILGEELGQIQISTIIKHLTNYGITALQSSTLNRKKNVLLVELSNAQLIFQEAMDLKIMKNYKMENNGSGSNTLTNNMTSNIQDNRNGTTETTLETQMPEENKVNGAGVEKDILQSGINEEMMSIRRSEVVYQASRKQKEIRLNQIDPRILIYEKWKPITMSIVDNSNLQKGLGLFTPAERLRITFSYMNKIYIKDIKFMEFLQDQGSISEVVPLHEKNAIINDNIQSLEDYYGENISVYFEFLDSYQKWLVLPATGGFIVFVSQYFLPLHLQEATNVIYSILICLWTTLFYLFWKRRQSELQVKWGVFGKKTYNEDRNVNFKGIKRIKSTSMEIQEFYPKSKRFYLYLISAFEGLPLLILAFALKVIIFNLSGLITEKEQLIYFQSVAKLTQPKGILHNLPLKDTLFNIIMIVIILQINDFYNNISKKSTKRENHRTNFDFNSSLVIKRFIFELINRFTHFFFLAFVIRDIVSVKTMLRSLFLMDEVRKVATESLIPWIVKTFVANKRQSDQKSDDDTIKRSEEVSNLYADSLREIDTWQYDDFDDYIEVVAQIAFITLFAAISPLAASLSYIFNFFERTSDKFKLQNRLYRRPLPFKVQGIGAWNKVLMLISVICIYTNVAFLAFDHFQIYETSDDSSSQDTCSDEDLTNQGKLDYEEQVTWKNVYITIFTLEHMILLLIVILHLSVSQLPKWVRVYKRRMAYRQQI